MSRTVLVGKLPENEIEAKNEPEQYQNRLEHHHETLEIGMLSGKTCESSKSLQMKCSSDLNFSVTNARYSIRTGTSGPKDETYLRFFLQYAFPNAKEHSYFSFWVFQEECNMYNFQSQAQVVHIHFSIRPQWYFWYLHHWYCLSQSSLSLQSAWKLIICPEDLYF